MKAEPLSPAAPSAGPRVGRPETLYVESSALLRIWLERDRSLASDMRKFTRFFTSALTLVEVPRSVSRARREGRLTRAQYARVLRRYRAFVGNCMVVEITPPVRERAAIDFPIEPVRSLDAIHIATVATWSDALGRVIVASCDQRISQNALALGFQVIPAELGTTQEI